MSRLSRHAFLATGRREIVVSCCVSAVCSLSRQNGVATGCRSLQAKRITVAWGKRSAAHRSAESSNRLAEGQFHSRSVGSEFGFQPKDVHSCRLPGAALRLPQATVSLAVGQESSRPAARERAGLWRGLEPSRMAAVTGRIIPRGAGKNEMAFLAGLTRGVRTYLTQRRNENISVGHKKMQ
jgi:hypothetical protein